MLSKARRQPLRHLTLVELHVPDFRRIKKFYYRLGSHKIWERQPEAEKGYLVLKYQRNVPCFWPGNKFVYQQLYFRKFPKRTRRGYGVEIVIMTPELKKVYQRAQKLRAVVDTFFRIVDPFGYYLRFTTPHNILANQYAVN